jgi:hypothetical protein
MKAIARLLSIAVLAVLAFAPGATASPNTPATFRFPFTETFVDDGVSAVCGYPVTSYLAGDITVEVFDQVGGPPRAQVHVNARGTFSGNGIVIGQFTNSTEVFDFMTGEDKQIAIAIRLTNPNGGLIYMDVGRLIFDGDGNLVFEAGPHPSLDHVAGCPFVGLT